MKVLFQNRADSLTSWGGDTTQMMKTKECLQKLGVEVEISLDAEPDLAGFDLVHLFNVQTADHGWRQMQHARRAGLPVVLSTIYWSNRHFYSSEDFVRYHCSPAVRKLARLDWRLPALLLKLNRRYGTKSELKHRRMLEAADLLLPNSYAEAEVLAAEFDAPWIRAKSLMVPNGIAVDSSPGPEAASTLKSTEKYVLEVGRIEPIKGQLKLIEALMDLPDIPLVFVGRSGNDAYYEKCCERGAQRGNTRFVAAVPHEEIGAYYAAAQVHVLPSLRESPGLVTLEAAMHGANCVVSFHGPIMEYFGSSAWSCDPCDPASIRQAVLSAWQSPPQVALRERILRNFTWDEAAKATLEGYRRALAQKS